MGKITLENINKSFGATSVLENINLEIEHGSFTILLGPSGCGKSTLLRIIAGLEHQDSGTVQMDHADISHRDPKDRMVSMVFQNYALYPHMTVFKNIEYGLKVQKVPKEERTKRVREAMALVELSDQEKKLPGQMSGGQRQRVALARAIVKNPEAYLMDEPLSNLDAKLRTQMRYELTEMHKKVNKTFLYVTHDQVEAMSMGTNIVILNQGKIMQQGTPREIYETPANLFVASFIGAPPVNIIKTEDFSIGIRPENVELKNEPGGEICLPCKVSSVEQLGSESIFHLDTPVGKINAKSALCWSDNQDFSHVLLPLEKIMVFDRAGDRVAGDKISWEQILRSFAI